MQKLRSFWKSSTDKKDEQTSTILERTQNFISSSLRRNVSPQAETTIQFDGYLMSLPSTYKNNTKNPKKKRKQSTSILKPELLKKCYQNLDPKYLDPHFEVTEDFFQKNRSISSERQAALYEQLDEVEVCLFNQISSRFDQIMSVLLTIRSLECLVVDNQHKLSDIRGQFLVKMKSITSKQQKGAGLSCRKHNIQKTLKTMVLIRKYKKFIEILSHNYLPSPQQPSETRQQLATSIQSNLPLYKSLNCTLKVESAIEAYQSDIRQNFSHTFNTKLFQYCCEYYQNYSKTEELTDSYSNAFWKKIRVTKSIFEDAHNESEDVSLNDSTFLNESMMESDGDSIPVMTFGLVADALAEEGIISYFNSCWNEGHFDLQGLKKMFSKYLKQIHHQFLTDFRQFCDSCCRQHNKTHQNPSLTNLLKELTYQFCVKIYSYFLDFHKNMLYRIFSITNRLLNFAANKTIKEDELTIEQKEKITILADGVINSCAYFCRIVVLKICETVELKEINEGIDIPDFKSVINVLELCENFISEKLVPLVSIQNIKCPQESSIYMLIVQARQKIPLNLLSQNKTQKLQRHLSRLHKNTIQQELKQSLYEEIWEPVDIPTFYYDTLHFMMTGQSLNLRRNKNYVRNTGASVSYNFETSVLGDGNGGESFMMKSLIGKTKQIADFRIIRNEIVIKNKMFKVTQTILLMVELIEDYILLAKAFSQLKKEVGVKLCELLRSYNTSSCGLIVHAGASALKKIKTKNITSRQLALSYLCLSFLLTLLEYEPMKSLLYATSVNQYGTQTDEQFNRITAVIQQHRNLIIDKLNQILIYKITSFQPSINFTDPNKQIPTKGTQGIIHNTKVLYEILLEYFDDSVLSKVFTEQIFGLYIQAIRGSALGKINNRIDAQGLKDDVSYFFNEIEGLGLHRLISKQKEQKWRIKAQDILRDVFEGLAV